MIVEIIDAPAGRWWYSNRIGQQIRVKNADKWDLENAVLSLERSKEPSLYYSETESGVNRLIIKTDTVIVQGAKKRSPKPKPRPSKHRDKDKTRRRKKK